MCIGFLNQINEYSNNFDYDEFYNGKYDYIEGHSFDDLENINFNENNMTEIKSFKFYFFS